MTEDRYQKADVRGQIFAHSSQIKENKDRKQRTEARGKRRLEAQGGLFKQRAEIGVHSRQLKAQGK